MNGLAPSTASITSLLLVALSLLLPIDSVCGQAKRSEIFAAAKFAPADVTTCLCIENAAQIRADLATRPIARLVEQVFEKADLRKAWRNLAARADLDEETLFDQWLGRRFTLFVSARGDSYDWAILTDVESKTGRSLLARMNPLQRAPRKAVPISEVPECELLFAAIDDQYLIGPTRANLLFGHLLKRLAGGDSALAAAREGGTLAESKAFETARSLGRGTAGLFVRHGAFLGGWSVLVARRSGEKITVRQAARFDEPPFARPVTTMRWDMSLLDAFDDAALLAVIEPTDIGDGPVERFAQLLLGEPLISAKMRANVDGARILTVGEVEGRREPHATDLLIPTGAVAIRMKDPTEATRTLDEQLQRVTRAIGSAAEGSCRMDVPPLTSLRAGVARHIDLQPALQHLGEGFPMMQSVSLNWMVATGPNGSYYVVATHPQHLGQTVRALEKGRGGAACVGKWTNCGTFDGRRVGVHLQSYLGQTQMLAPPDPADAESFRRTVLVLSELAAGVDRCRWRLARPTRETMRLEVELTLAPPESAETTK